MGDEYLPFIATYAAPAHAGLRVNTLKLSPQAFLGFSPFPLQPLPWTDVGFGIANESPPPGKHAYHSAGLYYLQEPSAMAVTEALAPQPGDKVLDLAAAPGGKTTHLAARLQGQGLLVANEIHPRRVWALAENLERWGTTNVVITNETPERLASHFGAYFDRVLLDAPCSGEGLFRKTPAAQLEWNQTVVQTCALRQLTILNQAARMVRPGGGLVYSTCTFAPQENEGVVAQFLQACQASDHIRFELVDLANISGLQAAHPEWIDLSNPLQSDIHLEYAARIWPHRSPGEGHFIALLQRADSGPTPPGLQSWHVSPSASIVLSRAQARYQVFCHESLVSEAFQDRLELKGTYLYQTPIPLAALQGLKVIHPGLWLGIVKKDRFEPSHALALALQPGQARRSLPLDPTSPACAAYLRGETLPASLVEGEGNGWTLVSLTTPDRALRFPLGWGRRSGDQVKNYYPKGLRRPG